MLYYNTYGMIRFSQNNTIALINRLIEEYIGAVPSSHIDFIRFLLDNKRIQRNTRITRWYNLKCLFLNEINNVYPCQHIRFDKRNTLTKWMYLETIKYDKIGLFYNMMLERDGKMISLPDDVIANINSYL